MVKIDELKKLIDCKVLYINEAGDECEGLLKFLGVQEDLAVFEHVFLLPGYEYMGTIHVSASRLISCKLLVPAHEILDESKFDPSLKLLIPGFEKGARVEDGIVIQNSDKYIPEDLPENLRDTCPTEFCIIDSFSEAFDEAIDHLAHSSSVGVSFQGCKISRNGMLSWVCISSKERVFLFDIDQLGKDAFDKGLRRIFEDEDVEKVIHDCRLAADCLLHKFQTEINNLIDTQVADYLINMQMYNGQDAFKYVISLDSCLAKYLKLPLRLLHNRNKLFTITEEKKFFEARPITKEFVNVLLKSAMFLLPLKAVQEKIFLHPFHQAVDAHLNSLRRADDAYVYHQSTTFAQLAPPEVSQCIQSIRFQELPLEEDYVSKLKSTLHGEKAWCQRMLMKRGFTDDSVVEDK